MLLCVFRCLCYDWLVCLLCVDVCCDLWNFVCVVYDVGFGFGDCVWYELDCLCWLWCLFGCLVLLWLDVCVCYVCLVLMVGKFGWMVVWWSGFGIFCCCLLVCCWCVLWCWMLCVVFVCCLVCWVWYWVLVELCWVVVWLCCVYWCLCLYVCCVWCVGIWMCVMDWVMDVVILWNVVWVVNCDVCCCFWFVVLVYVVCWVVVVCVGCWLWWFGMCMGLWYCDFCLVWLYCLYVYWMDGLIGFGDFSLCVWCCWCVSGVYLWIVECYCVGCCCLFDGSWWFWV